MCYFNFQKLKRETFRQNELSIHDHSYLGSSHTEKDSQGHGFPEALLRYVWISCSDVSRTIAPSLQKQGYQMLEYLIATKSCQC
jgi:hypothetical protein